SKPPAPARVRPDPPRPGLQGHVRRANRCSERRNFRHRIFALPPPRAMVSILPAAIPRSKVFCVAVRWYRLLSVSDDRPVLPAASKSFLERAPLFSSVVFQAIEFVLPAHVR